MFKLTGYMDDEKTAMLRCECGKVKTITYSNLSIHYSKYCMLKDGVELTCPYCGRKQTEKYIPLESQCVNVPNQTSSKHQHFSASNLPYWFHKSVRPIFILQAYVSSPPFDYHHINPLN